MGQRWHRSAGRRHVASVTVAAFLALGIVLSPPAVRPALAVGFLRTAADTTYTLDPEAGRVHVAIKWRVTNLKPNTPTTIYYYDTLTFSIQPDARAVRANDGSGDLSITTRKRKFFVEAEVHLRANLYHQQTSTFTIRYDLVGGAPRSDSPIRVGRAFATFGVWAWGDPGRGSVEVRAPKGFASQIDGDPMQIRNGPSGQTLAAEPADPGTFYAIVSAENRAAYGSTRISLPGDIEVVVRAWPEDDAWDETVSETLRTALPELLELIGLGWPVDHDLDVRERYTPALEGYAGIFFTAEERIDVSEDLDPVLVVHEASHAWFHGSLFTDRWVTEGLAQEYAWRVQESVGGDSGTAAEQPDLADPGYAALDGWAFPEVIRDQETDDQERYGYQAAFWVIHRIVAEAGVERMRAAFAAADGDRTAYPGAGAPEAVRAEDSWQRLLDLVQPPGQPASVAIDELFRDYVLRGNDLRELTNRREARDAYVELLEAGDGWLPPWSVRQPMGEWSFDIAARRMDEASDVLELRDRVTAAATALNLQPDGSLRQAYEAASQDLSEVTAIGEDQLEALAALGDARTRLATEPDLVSTIGLLGETPPATPYDAAREAFERGELGLSMSSAAAAVAIVSGAAAVGQQRLLIGAGIGILVLLVLVLLVVLLRRRGRRRRALALTPAFAGATEPYATLAADPAGPSPLPAANPPDLEGGPP